MTCPGPVREPRRPCTACTAAPASCLGCVRWVARPCRFWVRAGTVRWTLLEGAKELQSPRRGTGVGRFEESSEPPAVDPARALEVRLAEVQEQLRATSDILKVLTSGASRADPGLRRRRRQRPAAPPRRRRPDPPAQGRRRTASRWSSGLTEEFLEFVDRYPVHAQPRHPRRTRRHRPHGAADQGRARRPGLRPARAFQKLGGYRSILGAPMVVDDEVVGDAHRLAQRGRPVRRARPRTCSRPSPSRPPWPCATSSSSRALESRSAELARKVDQLEALAEVGEAISSTLVADEVLTTIVSHAVQLSGTDGGSLMEYDESTGLFGVRTAYGTSPAVVAALRDGRDPHRQHVGRPGRPEPRGAPDRRPRRGTAAAGPAPRGAARLRVALARRDPARATRPRRRARSSCVASRRVVQRRDVRAAARPSRASRPSPSPTPGSTSSSSGRASSSPRPAVTSPSSSPACRTSCALRSTPSSGSPRCCSSGCSASSTSARRTTSRTSTRPAGTCSRCSATSSTCRRSRPAAWSSTSPRSRWTTFWPRRSRSCASVRRCTAYA